MAVLLDIAIVVIFVAACVTGYVMGFVKYAVMMIRTLITVALAAIVAFTFASKAYDAVVGDKMVTKIEKQIEKIDVVSVIHKDLLKKGLPPMVTQDDLREVILAQGDLSENMRIMLEAKGADSVLADKVTDELENYIDTRLYEKLTTLTGDSEGKGHILVGIGLENKRDELIRLVRMITFSDKHKAAQQIEEKYVRPFVRTLIAIALFLITAAIVSLMMLVIIKLAGLLDRIKIMSAANSFAGLALGVVKATAYVLLTAFIFSLMIDSSDDRFKLMNTAIIDNTYLYKYFFYLLY